MQRRITYYTRQSGARWTRVFMHVRSVKNSISNNITCLLRFLTDADILLLGRFLQTPCLNSLPVHPYHNTGISTVKHWPQSNVDNIRVTYSVEYLGTRHVGREYYTVQIRGLLISDGQDVWHAALRWKTNTFSVKLDINDADVKITLRKQGQERVRGLEEIGSRQG